MPGEQLWPGVPGEFMSYLPIMVIVMMGMHFMMIRRLGLKEPL